MGIRHITLFSAPNRWAPFGRTDNDDDLFFAQGASLFGQFAHEWKLRVLAQETDRKNLAEIKSRRLLAQTKSFNCASAQVGNSVLSYQTSNRGSSPQRRGPVKILAIDDAWATAKF